MSGKNLAVARASWGAEIPAWVIWLAEECDHTSQVRTAGQLGYSPAAVNCVLKNVYRGATRRVQQVVEDRLMQAEVACPFFGRLLRTRCHEILSGRGPAAVRRSCRACGNNPGRKISTQHAKGESHEAES